MTPFSFAFARKVDEALRQQDQIPLYGTAPHLDLDHFSSILKQRLEASDFSISMVRAAWRAVPELLEDLSPQLPLNIALFPLKGTFLWVMSKQDIAKFSTLLLGQEHLRSELLQEGFYLYSVLKVLDILQTEPPLKDFTLRLLEDAFSHTEPSYCVDLKLSLGSCSSFGRLLFPASFLSSWRSHFASLSESFSLSPMAKHVEVTLSIQIGSVLLSQEAWNTLKMGDLLLLDQSSYHPHYGKGVASLCLGETLLFYVKIKTNKIQLLDTTLCYEENMDEHEEPSPHPEESSSTTVSQNEERFLKLKELPLSITVELARMQITVDRLMNLLPGNFLELPIHPEQGVTLSIKGNKIARGVLVQLGETLGVRILEI